MADQLPAPCPSLGPPFYEHLESMIHDQVLQSLGVSILQADLCRRLWSARREQDAGLELDNLVQALQTAVDGLRHVMGDLRLAASAGVALG